MLVACVRALGFGSVVPFYGIVSVVVFAGVQVGVRGGLGCDLAFLVYLHFIRAAVTRGLGQVVLYQR